MKCEACGQYLPTDVAERVKEFLPENVEIYDFGGNNIVAPVPDVKSTGNGSYLSTHFGALVGKKDGSPIDSVQNNTDYLYMPFEIALKVQCRSVEDMEEAIIESAKKACKFWPSRAAAQFSLDNMIWAKEYQQ